MGEQPEKRVTWAELFFDLIFVFAITQVSALLRADHSLEGIGRALVVFIPVYWVWVATSLHSNRQDIENPLDRLGVFSVGLCALFMGLALPQAYGDRGILFGGAYWVSRLVIQALVLRWQYGWLNGFGVAAAVTGPMLLLGGFLDGTARIALWAGAALVDTAVPLVLRRRLAAAEVRFEPSHLPERFGLLVIVALGESIVAIGAPATESHGLGVAELTAVSGAFVLAAGLWWVYFAFAASAMRFAVATSARQVDTVREVLSYAHIGLIGGVIAVAVGMHDAVAHPGHHLPAGVAGLLFGGTALYLAMFGYTRWRMFRLVSTTRLGTAAVVLAVLPLGLHLPALASLWLLAGLLTGLNALEWARARRS
ncbi:low temperature requirement A [Streptomyces bingchenggensis BCW-1]|uniref:Low temperature requirement A n=1 Tax=Streptomyces bingchenggensis (strain BCW-1) TaxID=749414 RepID=D7BQQ8_STRBB|nr:MULTISPECIES: low temperature requirement protein A [Streptomyces]ADI09275.1 low temperature requirement A [Streptomyces bingchenggensis BCW-1]